MPPMTPSTFGQHGAIYELETFLLEDAGDTERFSHWSAHLRSFWGWYDAPPVYTPRPHEFELLRCQIAEGLGRVGFAEFAEEIATCTDVDALNLQILRQYTCESRLYAEINQFLLSVHSGAELRSHPFKAWILQLNCAMRLRPLHEDVAWRGVHMSAAAIAAYQPEVMYTWATFVSASRDRRVAEDLRANVLFEIFPWGSHSLYAKRNAYDIASASTHPDEGEVIFPVACTFRVKSVTRTAKRAHVVVETVDQY